MNKRIQISGIALLMLYALFFASTNFFVHTHDGPHCKIVHSHPWSGHPHNHSAGEYQLIHFLSTQAYIAPSMQDVPQPLQSYGHASILVYRSCGLSASHRLTVKGRAPPTKMV